MINSCVLFLFLGPSLYFIAEGCGRVPATPAPTTPIVPTEPTINGSVRSIECSQEEVNSTACLNGGTCFAMELNDGERIASCHCPENYKGQRCQEFYIPILPSQDDPVARAGIAASIAVLVVIVVVFTVVAILYYRRKKQERLNQESKNGMSDVHRPLNENHTPARNMHPSVYTTNGNGIYINREEKIQLFQDYKHKVTSV